MKLARGFGLIELLISVLIISVGVAGTVAMQQALYEKSHQVEARMVAMDIAQKKLEELRSFSDAPDWFSFASIAENTGGPTLAGGIPIRNMTYDLSWTVTELGAGTVTQPPKQVQVKVEWDSLELGGDSQAGKEQLLLSGIIGSVGQYSSTGVLGNLR